jgi:hypothetical protein
VADVFGVVYYRRHAHLGRITRLVPWVLVGMVLGAAALALPEVVLRRIVGAIVLAMIAVHLWRKRGGGAAPPQGLAPAVAFGTATGFATTVANAAGPVMNVYLLAQRLPKDEFIGTGAWFFLTVNVLKLPILGAHGLIGARSLLFDLAVAPALVVGALLGRAVLQRLPQRIFEVVVLVLTTLASLPLLLRG